MTGTIVTATKSDMARENDTTAASWPNMMLDTPVRNSMGTNTAMCVSVEARIADQTSSDPSIAAVILSLDVHWFSSATILIGVTVFSLSKYGRGKGIGRAMKATKEIIWDWDLDTGEVTRGKAFKKITGYDMKGSVQKLDFLVSKIHPEDRQRVHDSLHAAVAERGKRKWREEYRIIGACGETIDIVDRGFIVRDTNGSALRMVGSALDVTKTRHALKKIKHQNRLLKEIAWDQSHLVRAPLVRMQGLLDLLKMEDPSIISSEKILQLLYASTDEMDQIIREIVKKSEQIDYVS